VRSSRTRARRGLAAPPPPRGGGGGGGPAPPAPPGSLPPYPRPGRPWALPGPLVVAWPSEPCRRWTRRRHDRRSFGYGGQVTYGAHCWLFRQDPPSPRPLVGWLWRASCSARRTPTAIVSCAAHTYVGAPSPVGDGLPHLLTSGDDVWRVWGRERSRGLSARRTAGSRVRLRG
jgi:hypothetical protein